MLNTLYVIREQKGFILPFVLFTVAIIMIFVISGIHIYKNNTQLTHVHIQQLKIETLFQSALALYKQDLNNGDVPPSTSTAEDLTLSYTLPDGEVKIFYRKAKETEVSDLDNPMYRLRCRITIGDLIYSFKHYVSYPDEEE